MLNKIVNSFLVSALILLPLFPVQLSLVSAAGTTTPYKVTIRAVFADQRVSGVTFDLIGSGITKTATATKDQDIVFTDLPEGQHNIKITFPGDSEYESADGATNKIIDLKADTPEATVIFNLQKKAPDVDTNLEKIKNFKWPSSLTKVGSKTTDLAKLKPEQLAGVTNFTFDNPGVNQIVYTQPLDLENYDDYKGIESIEDYIDIETVGKIGLETDFIKPFNKEAKLVMMQVNLVKFMEADGSEGPVAIIKRDGEKFSEAKNLKYEGKTLSFVVPGFSTYTLAPRLSVTPTGLTSDSDASLPSPSYTAESKEIEIVIATDNLDAEIQATNNGEVMNLPEKVNSEGMIKQTVSLGNGENKIRIIAKLANGETEQKIINVNYKNGESANNDVSKWFTVGIIVLIFAALIAAVGYMYYRQRKKQQEGVNPNENLLAKKEADAQPEKPKYEEGLLTDEEKKLYEVGTKEPAADKDDIINIDKTADADSKEKEQDSEEVDKPEVK